MSRSDQMILHTIRAKKFFSNTGKTYRKAYYILENTPEAKPVQEKTTCFEMIFRYIPSDPNDYFEFYKN